MSQSLYEVIRPDLENDISYDRDDQAAWYTSLEKKRIRTVCGDLNVSLGGKSSGKAMVFWSSLMLNGSMWKFQHEAFKADYRIILIDSPGHGESEALRKTMDLRDSAQCVVDILDNLEIDKCILVGNSWGGCSRRSFLLIFQIVRSHQ
jgi:3-oxoadipate enol-lactonase